MKQIEAGLIGIWLTNYKKEYIPQLSTNDFNFYKQTFQKIQSLYEQGKDIAPPFVVGEYKLSDLFSLTVTTFPNSIEEYIELLKKNTMKENLKRIILSESDPNEMVEQILNIQKIADRKNTDLTITTAYERLYDELINRKENLKKAMKYGIPALDNLTNGLAEGSLTIIAGRPGTGKSAFATQLGYNVAADGHKVLIVSLEMNESELTERILCRYDVIDGYRIKNGEFTSGDKEQLRNLKEEFKLLNILIDTRARTIINVRNLITKYSPDLVIVDQIGLMSDTQKTPSRREALVNISRNLKLTAMDYKIPIVALAQINRDAQENYPTLANLKESGALEEDSNTVIMLHRLSNKQALDFKFSMFDLESMAEKHIYPVLLMLAKNRNGITENVVAEFIGSKYIFRKTERIKK